MRFAEGCRAASAVPRADSRAELPPKTDAEPSGGSSSYGVRPEGSATQIAAPSSPPARYASAAGRVSTGR
ncbi:hypothetical protein ACFQYP_13120 [Nonomuraea antimicrobica]